MGQYVTISDDVISHVNISSVKEEDGGEYTCTAKNSIAHVSYSARINVYGKEGFTIIHEIGKTADPE